MAMVTLMTVRSPASIPSLVPSTTLIQVKETVSVVMPLLYPIE